jgi:hypothetical protein
MRRRRSVIEGVRAGDHRPLSAEPSEHEPTVQEVREHADILSRHEREAEAFEIEMIEDEERYIRECEAKAEADIALDLSAVHTLENTPAEEAQPDDAELIEFCRTSVKEQRQSLAIDRREREGPWRSTARRPPARRARSACGGRRRPGARRGARARAPAASDSEGEPRPRGYPRRSRTLRRRGRLHVVGPRWAVIA